MKAKLEFDLPEEKDDLRDALDAPKWRVVVSELDNWLRNKHKYEDHDHIPIDDVRSKLHELLQESGIEL